MQRPAVGPPPVELLRPFERITIEAFDLLARRAVPATETYLRHVGAAWITAGTRHILHPHGLERLAGVRPEDGVLLVSNHRSYFDLYMLSVLLHRYTPLRQPVFCPVRAEFFYQSISGVLVNLFVGAGRMFPPVFREPAKAEFNKWALARVCEILRGGSVLVGFHPEGRRNKNADPYTPLPAQPGVGKVVMETWPVIVPAFIYGPSNNILGDIYANYRRSKRMIAVFGEPVDLAPFRAMSNRLASHKRIADKLIEIVYRLGDEERRVRAALPPIGSGGDHDLAAEERR